jgi:elongator complex protein 1
MLLLKQSDRQSSRSKRKMERKIGSGRKGTVDEEEYLLKSVTKLVGRFNTVQGMFRDRASTTTFNYIWKSSGEVGNILPHLYQFTSEHRSEGISLQNDFDRFTVELGEAVEKIWPTKTEVECGEVPTETSWASRMAEKEKEQQVDASQRVVKPEMTTTTTTTGQGWRLDLFDFEDP